MKKKNSISSTCSTFTSRDAKVLWISDRTGEAASNPADEQYGVTSIPSHLFGLHLNFASD
jgi:hypothetical protein